MDYDTLLDKSIKKAAAIEKAAKSGTIEPSARPDPDKRERLLSFKQKGELASSPLLDAALKATQSAEQFMKRARSAGLQGAELRKARQRAYSDAIKAVEQEKGKRIASILEALDKRERAYQKARNEPNLTTNQHESLQLQRLQLRHAQTTESEAMTQLTQLERSGQYSEDELLVLSAKGERAAKRARQIMEATPPALATEEGGQLLKELEQLTQLSPGQVPYQYSRVGTGGTVNVAELMAEAPPTLEDIEPEPAPAE